MTNMQKQTMGLSEWILLIVLSVLWGGSFFFIKIALKDLQPLDISKIVTFCGKRISEIFFFTQTYERHTESY